MKQRHRPRLRTIEKREEERHASWHELFFDLIFVLAVARVAHSLSHDLTYAGAIRYVMLFAPIWWTWVGYTFYADRFETSDLSYRFMMFLGMLSVAALSINIGGAFSDGSFHFTLAYVAVRAVLIALYLRAYYHIPLARELCGRYIAGFTAGAAIWLYSGFISPPQKYYLWAAGLLIELITPIVTSRAVKRAPYDASHVLERFGLFTLIVIGEAVLTAVMALADTTWNINNTLIAITGFAACTAIWWIYYEFVETSGLKLGWRLSGQTYVYAHFPLVLGIAAVGVGTQHAVSESREAFLSEGTRWAISLGIALFILAISAIRITSKRTHLISARIIAALFLLALGIVGNHLSPLLFMFTILCVLCAGVFVESLRAVPLESIDKKCTHIWQINQVEPNTVGCEECVKMNDKWVHLRMCCICGHVGCCDSSKNKHATAHFNGTGHTIIRSLEQEENWSWCYVDEMFVQPETKH
jgi:low temperature requirement protein LtrA